MIIEDIMGQLAIFFLIFITLGLAILLALLGYMTIRSNLLGWFLLVSGAVYFFGVVIVYWMRGIRFWRPRAKGNMVREERNDWSFWFIVAGMVAIFYLPPVEYVLLSTVLPRNFWMQITGLFLIFFGSILFIWARRTLGNWYSGHVSVVEGQPLVQSGPYCFIRHPAYAGYILIACGVAVGYSSLLGFVVIPLILLPSVIYRLSVEDRLLAEHFGEEYRQYAKKVARLIPRIW